MAVKGNTPIEPHPSVTPLTCSGGHHQPDVRRVVIVKDAAGLLQHEGAARHTAPQVGTSQEGFVEQIVCSRAMRAGPGGCGIWARGGCAPHSPGVLGSDAVKRGSRQCQHQRDPRGPCAALQAELGDTKEGPSLRVSPTTPILQNRSPLQAQGTPPSRASRTPPTPLFGATSPPWCTLTQAVGCGQQQEQQEQQRAHGAGAEFGVRAQGGGQTPCPPCRTRLRPPTTHIPVRPQPRGKQVGLVSLQSITLRLGALWVVC